LQHDLRVGSAGSVTPGAVLIALVELPDLAINSASRQCVALLTPSPPVLFSQSTPLPLRI
jgi:hypothetical protein